ncbi:tRNA1(Val) (adenine(37)-N6)-methyltransferase [Desulfovibrio litoralis]|uniref:tRNA1(Val) A37 N6-methylase TrmN6 n=1 Tax=Desulfovibrio litoralis DSM 11393 TaxID=1121455 RepID=A0A1M7SNR9_9BACT|nr:hypothetical protein [Desulfovibrio litoralis]SHN60147.1 tRNA1(Val) A37 N6-methylase TrmN6 [Desulfovibrio litoralis DSM 11393]
MIFSKNTISSQQESRTLFPRALIQPEGSFRFSAEALLLASFVYDCENSCKDTSANVSANASTYEQKKKILNFADLGTGCGVIPFALFLLNQNNSKNKTPLLFADGYELIPDLCKAALKNALNLGFNEFFNIINLDLSKEFSALKKLQKPLSLQGLKQLHNKSLITNQYDFIVTNPPYRLSQCGKVPQSELRRIALFEERGSLKSFALFAKHKLKKQGALYCVYPTNRKDYLLNQLTELNLYPKRILHIYGNENKVAPFFLIEAINELPVKPSFLPPLTLYRNNCVTKEALDFCPFLSCNQKRN